MKIEAHHDSSPISFCNDSPSLRKDFHVRSSILRWQGLMKLLIFFNMISISIEMEVSTYDNDFQITKETFDKDSNLSIAADALQQPGSCRIYSSGVLFTLKSNYQQNLQINSIDIFTTAKIPIHFDIWVSRGNQTNQFYAEDMTFHNWTKCCCDSPVMGKGSKLPTNIPFNIMLQFGGYDVISLLIKTQNTNTDIISSAFGCSGFDPTLPSGKGNKYLDINLEATVSEGSKKNTHYHPEQLIWNGAMNFEVYSQNLDMKEGNATSKYLGLYHHHEILSLNHNVEERRLQPCRFNQQLTTPTEGTTASYGIMFDIVPLNDLVLETIEFHCRKDRGELFNYEVYAKAGGHSNFETDQNKWTSISEGALHVAGWEKFTGIPNDEFTRITMKAGEVYSLYLASNSSDILYGTGLEVGRINAADSNMQILEGLSMAAFPPFSDDIFSPRTFQGRVHYSTATECSEILESTNVAVTRMPTISPTLAPTPCASEYLASTTFTGTSASFGIMFEATSKERDLLVEGFQVRSSKVAGSLLKYTIYSKEDSYRRFETNPNAWEVISDGFTTSEGRETLTTLSIDRSLGINIQPSIVRAFYITFATPDLLYSIGEDEGTMFLSDDNIELYEGIGIAEYPPFGTSFMIPRRYEGVVQYFIEEDCSDKAIEPSFSPTSPILASNMPTSSSTEPQTSIPSTNANDSESPTGSPFAQVENLIISQSSSPPTPTSVESNTQNTPQPTISMTNKTTSSFPTEQPSKPILNGTFNERTAPTAKTNPTRPSNLTNNSDSGGELSTMGHFSSSGSLSGVNISSTGNKPTCNLLNDLNTTTNGNLSSFGNIFEVRVASQSLIVETIGFMSNKPIGTGLNYSIFFKEGSFRQFESDSSKWSKNSEGNVISEGNTNMTQIPYGNFEPILLDANTSYSFYFILDSPDVMYDIRKSEDRPYLFDEHLEVVEGTNVENHPPFESYTFSGNLWIGSIVYSIQAECIVPSTSPLSLLEPSNSSLGNTLAILTPSSNPSLSNSEVESFPSFNLEFEKEKIMEPVEKIHSISINFTDIVSDDTPNSGLSSKFLNNEENTTSVTLKFLIENTFMNEIQSDFIIAQINEAMEESVSNMIATDSSFIQYAEDFNLELRSVTSEMNHILKDHECK